ncbi:sensor histidine kinase [Clostridium sp.]|uniref:sensor histidine kinase n=1 Tax=Clostridium sp. TaxID=1506 RepID=UPI0039F4FAD0
MNEMLFYLISACLFFAIFRESMGIFFVKKNVPYFFSFFVWLIFFGIDILCIKYIAQPIILLAWEIVSSFCLCMLLYWGSIRKKIIWIVIVNLMGMITEMIGAYIFIFMDIQFKQSNILGSFISKIILLILLMIIKLFIHTRLKRDIPLSYWFVLFFIPLGSIFVLNTLFFLSEYSYNKNASVLSMFSSAFILGVNFIVLSLYENLSDRFEIQKQQIIFNKQIELCKNQIHEREESNLNIRNIKHDIENHLICIRECVEREDLESAKRYIDDLLKGEDYFKTDTSIDSGNIVIDALLNYKNSIMKQSGIKMFTHIEIPYDLKFNDADICVILGNCLDNSIEAVCKIDDESMRVINVEIIYRKGILLIKISNPYTGALRKDKQGNYVTTKTDAENHGIGLNSVKKAVKKYDGLVSILTDNNIFTVQILMYSSGKNYI